MAKMVHCTYTTVWKSVHLTTLLIKEFSKICRKFIKFYMWAKTVNRVRTEPNFKTKFELFLNIFVQFPKGSWFYKITFFFQIIADYHIIIIAIFFLNSWNDEARSIGKILRKPPLAYFLAVCSSVEIIYIYNVGFVDFTVLRIKWDSLGAPLWNVPIFTRTCSEKRSFVCCDKIEIWIALKFKK